MAGGGRGIEPVQFAHGAQVPEGFLGLAGVDDRDRDADVHEHVVAGPRLGRAGQADDLDHAAEADAPAALQRVFALGVEELPWDGEAHGDQGIRTVVRFQRAPRAWPAAIAPSLGGSSRGTRTSNPAA